MQLQSILFSMLLATSLAADANDKSYEKSQCRQMRKLQKFVNFVSNTTRLQDITNNNATKIAELQEEAAAASSRLTTLQSNATLVKDCGIINAAEQVQDGCEETWELQAFIKFASNTTALAAKTNNNATRMANIQAKASKAAALLQTLMSNSTLQAACPAILQREECHDMMKLEKFIAKAHNKTLVDKVTNGNATKAEMIRAEAAQVQAKLTELQGNKTFVKACADMGMTGKTGKGIDSSASTHGGATHGKSAAAAVQVGSIQVMMLSTILLVAAGMFLM